MWKKITKTNKKISTPQRNINPELSNFEVSSDEQQEQIMDNSYFFPSVAL